MRSCSHIQNNSANWLHETMVAVYALMNKWAVMAEAAEKYEDEVLGLKPQKAPETIVEIVELRMFESKMTQAKLAKESGLGKSKVSEILTGKRKPDISFLKGVHRVLKIDADFLLEHA